jgi:hypothetical protein
MMIKKQSILHTSILLTCLIAVVLQLASCERNRCVTRGTECLNEGVCNDGNCLCPAEFDGDSCQFASNKKFAGVYEGLFKKVGLITPQSDTITVKQIPGKNLKISWTSYQLKNAIITANIKSNDIVVPATISPDGFTYQGSGSLNKDIITLSMRADSIVGGNSFKSVQFTFGGNRIK